MDVVVGRRGGGKTARLLQIIHEAGEGILLCSSDESARYARKLARWLGYPDVEIVTLDTRGRYLGRHRPQPIYIDDADSLITALTGLWNIAGISVTGEPMTVDNGRP